MNIGYKRVSSVDQNTDRQLEGEQLDKVFIDKCSGKDRNRPQLQILLEHVASKGDTLYVHSLDRLARNMIDLRNIVDELTAKGVIVKFVKEALTFQPNTNNQIQNLMLGMLGSFAEFEREMINERQREGIAIAKKKGKHLGRYQSLNSAAITEIKTKLAAGQSKCSLAKEYAISLPTLYKYLREQ